MPSQWIFDRGLRDFTWFKNTNQSRSTAIAALQLYIAMLTQADTNWAEGDDRLICGLSYEELKERTGLSRQLIALGIQALDETKLIEVARIGVRNRYEILGFDIHQGWCKVPARALYNTPNPRKIVGFQLFTKRSMHELDALKLFLYYAAIRGNFDRYSVVTYETINKQTGVPLKRIAKANAFLVAAGMLADVKQEQVGESHQMEPNKYYLVGNQALATRRR